MSKTLIVAWREFRQTVMRPVFVIAVVGMPLVFLGLMVLMVQLMIDQEEPPLLGTVAIIDPSGETADAAQIEFDQERIHREAERESRQMAEDVMRGQGAMTPGAAEMPARRGEVRIDIQTHGPDEADVLKQQVTRGDLLALAIIPQDILDIPAADESEQRFQLYVSETTDSDHVNLIERRLGAAIVRVRAERVGLDPDRAMAMLDRPEAETGRASAEGGFTSESRATRELRQLIPAAFFLLIWIGTLVSGQNLMMSTIEEKSNRVMEVLLSAVSSLQLMTGKILGFGGVGLLIVGIYGSVAIAALVLLATFSSYVTTMDLVYLVIFYLMAYFMIASLMAAVGSAVSDIREANTLVTPVMMVLVVPWILWMPITQSPNGAVAVAFSFIPPAIPFAMILRLAAEEPIPLWQIPASIVWGSACVFGMVWMAAKIFRVGVLMYGKPPTPWELIKWLRYS